MVEIVLLIGKWMVMCLCSYVMGLELWIEKVGSNIWYSEYGGLKILDDNDIQKG